jgi:cytochrome c biogenesis protein CcdA
LIKVLKDNFLKKRIFWLIAVGILLLAAGLYFNSPSSAQILSLISNNGKWFLPVLITAAITESLNPCAYSVLLLTIAFLFSLGRVRSDILKVGAMYILAIFFTYIAIGLGFLRALDVFNVPHFVSKIGAFLLLFLGAINLINTFFPKFPIKLSIPKGAHGAMAKLMEKASLPTAFALGALVGLSEFPCTGGPYIVVLGMLHDQALHVAGLAYLLLFNLIFIVPLIIFLGIASEQSLLAKVQEWKKTETGNMRFWSGVVMIVLGIIILAV